MSQFSTESITTPGQRPVRVVFNQLQNGNFQAVVTDALEGYAIKGYDARELSRAEFDALPFDPRDPNVFGAASMALFTATPKRLDHGVLSIPGRTNTINADLDKYKAAQAKIEKREREDRRFLANERAEAAKPAKAQALALYKAHGKLLRAAVKGKLQGTGQTPAEWLKIEAAVRPEWFIKFTAEVVRDAESWG